MSAMGEVVGTGAGPPARLLVCRPRPAGAGSGRSLCSAVRGEGVTRPVPSVVLRQIGLSAAQNLTPIRELEVRLDRPLVPNVEVPPFPFTDDRVLARLRAKEAQLRGRRGVPILPDQPGRKPVRPRPAWNSVVLFFNLVKARQPDDYQATTPSDARNWLDEGD